MAFFPRLRRQFATNLHGEYRNHAGRAPFRIAVAADGIVSDMTFHAGLFERRRSGAGTSSSWRYLALVLASVAAWAWAWSD